MQTHFILPSFLGFEHFWSINKNLYFAVVSKRKQFIFTDASQHCQLFVTCILLTAFQSKVILFLFCHEWYFFGHTVVWINNVACFRLNYSQEYIEHGYKELAMFPKDGEAGLSLFEIYLIQMNYCSSYLLNFVL